MFSVRTKCNDVPWPHTVTCCCGNQSCGSASNPDLGSRDSEIKLEVKALAGDSDFMAGGGNGAGPAQEVTHQPPGDGKQE